MALIQCDFFSDVLGLSTSMNVILPQATNQQVGMKGKADEDDHPVLWLLHGRSDDHTTWSRLTSIERYVSELGIAVVMPNAHRSFYADMANGHRYWTFLTEELPQVARSFFPLSVDREKNFVAGLSMGGYGAFKWALRKPECFAAAASLSGVLDLVLTLGDRTLDDTRELENIWGNLDLIKGSEDDLMTVAANLVETGREMPRLYQCCGTGDFLYRSNISFRDHAVGLGLDLTYEEGPGEHEWGYWDRMIQRAITWFLDT
ncbi:MAG: esterase family protein [Verrucomicrobia bacterium]|nr:esterase family protein [Verrucomicrobiota bacterium]